MNINNNIGNAPKPAFRARLMKNEPLEEVLNHINKDDKHNFDKALKNLSFVATDDVVELRKTKENNTEVYSLVNTKNEKKNVLVCKIFPEVKAEENSHLDYIRHNSKMEYVRESLIETLKHVSEKWTDGFHALFVEKSHPGHSLNDFYNQ